MRLIKDQWKTFLLCLKIYADMLPSIAKSVIAKKILKIEIPRLLQALGGLINAVVSCLITFLWYVYIHTNSNQLTIILSSSSLLCWSRFFFLCLSLNINKNIIPHIPHNTWYPWRVKFVLTGVCLGLWVMGGWVIIIFYGGGVDYWWYISSWTIEY